MDDVSQVKVRLKWLQEIYLLIKTLIIHLSAEILYFMALTWRMLTSVKFNIMGSGLHNSISTMAFKRTNCSVSSFMPCNKFRRELKNIM